MGFNRFDFYRDIYYKELDRKDRLSDQLGLPIGIISVIVAGLFFLGSKYNYQGNGILLFAFLTLIGLSVLGILTTVVFLILSYLGGYKFEGIAYADEIEEYHSKFIQDFKDQNAGTDTEAEEQFENYITGEFVKYSSENTLLNDRKTSFLFRAKQFLILSVVLTFFASIPFLISSFPEREKINQVKIVNFTDKFIDQSLRKDSLLIKSLMKTLDTMTQEKKFSAPPPPKPRKLTEGIQPRKSEAHKKATVKNK